MVVEILLRHLEKEQSLHRKIDMFFLADSIIRYTRGQKDIAGDEYPSLFQSVLGRLIASAAPPGISSWENRRQCLKVLKLWLDRKTFSESILRHHIWALESINEEPFNNVFCRRLLRRERPLDDPAREMEGMLVDEYGSNTSFELPGLLNSQIFKDMDDGSDNDEKIFEAVTPEHDHKIDENNNTVSTSSNMTGQRKHILEDVDGELEMEDVAPPDHAVDVDRNHHPLTFTPPLPNDKPPSPPPLPSSPPPNMQIHLQPSNTKLIETNIQKASSSSDAVALPYYTPGYRDHRNHIPPHSSLLSSSCTYGNNNSSPHLPSVQCIKNPQLVNAIPMNTTAYHLQPPPPPEVSSQFSYLRPDPHRNIQPWFGNDRHVGNDYSDRIRMMQQHESCDYSSSSVLPGHLPSGSTEPSCSISYYGPPHNSSLMPNPNWPHPPQESNYRYPQPPLHRPMENHLLRKARAPAFWRP